MVQGLAKKAKGRVIISFAPDTWYYRALKSFGQLFPGPSKTTRAYLHTEEAVVAALEGAGFKITRTEMTGTSFYFSRLLGNSCLSVCSGEMRCVLLEMRPTGA